MAKKCTSAIIAVFLLGDTFWEWCRPSLRNWHGLKAWWLALALLLQRSERTQEKKISRCCAFCYGSTGISSNDWTYASQVISTRLSWCKTDRFPRVQKGVDPRRMGCSDWVSRKMKEIVRVSNYISCIGEAVWLSFFLIILCHLCGDDDLAAIFITLRVAVVLYNWRRLM